VTQVAAEVTEHTNAPDVAVRLLDLIQPAEFKPCASDGVAS
jgi:hypothetical protein